MFDTSHTILIGRKLAVDYIPFREDTVTQPEHEMFEMAKRIVTAKKIVFTKTLNHSMWPNTVLAKGNLPERQICLGVKLERILSCIAHKS
ncbi:MAG: hypothetical protein IPG01_17005 [Chitinophagaceae bacterium]|nr:hypothetical protein [Chitinophagaceae bacterium]